MSASTEFTDPDLIAIYDTINPIDDKTDFFVDLADRLQVDTVIDLGCGTGLLSYELTKHGRTVIGIEPAAGMIKQAKQKYGDVARWIVGGYEKLDVEMHADMTIMTGHVAQFFLEDTEWNEALRAMYSATKPGGYLVFESRNPKVKPFTNWPDIVNHETIADTPLGVIEWWADKLVYARDYAIYELHYLFTETGKEIISANKLRFRSYEEIQVSLESAGFSIENVYGDWSGAPLEAQSPEMIFITSRL
jgi:SAM-dependent methyltransferase